MTVLGIISAAALVSACGGTATNSGSALPAARTTSTTVASHNAGVQVALQLRSPSIVSGQRVDATLVIQNDSGAPVVSNACVPTGESALGQIGLATDPPPPTTTTTTTTASNSPTSAALPTVGGAVCIGPAHELVGRGTTRLPFTLEASTSLCQIAPASSLHVPTCLPGGAPLRPGVYYVSFDWYGPLPTPAITVRVTAATS